MADLTEMKTFRTRVQNKIDTFKNWTDANPTPLEGEICIVVVPAAAGAVVQEPAILFKVGDGTTEFNKLGFASAISADIHDWAKASVKPTYKAEEIEELDTHIAEYVQTEMGISVDTDTQYTIVPVDGNAYQYKLMSKGKDDETYATEVATFDIPKYDDTALAGRVTDLEGLVGSTAVAAQIAAAIADLDLANTYEAKGEAAKVLSSLDEYKTANDAAISAIKDGTAVDSFADVEAELAKKVDKVEGKSLVSDTEITKLAGVSEGANKVEASETNGNIKIDGVDTVVYTHPEKHAIADVEGLQEALDGMQAAGDFADAEHKHVSADITDLDATIKEYDYATKSEAQNYANAKDEAIAEAKKAGDDAQSAVDELAAKVGTVSEGKTVVEMIEDAKTAATYDDSALVARVEANEDAIELLNGDSATAGSVDYKIAQAVAAIMENPDETMNSINELVTWINGHATDALEFSNKVTQNETDIAALEELVGTTDVATQITDAIAAALTIDGVDKYALASDLTAAIARIAALETEIAKKANDADLAAVAKTGNVDDLVQTDNTYIVFNCGSATDVI